MEKLDFESRPRAHRDPCCCQWGCKCRVQADGSCRVCEEKLKRDAGRELAK